MCEEHCLRQVYEGLAADKFWVTGTKKVVPTTVDFLLAQLLVQNYSAAQDCILLYFTYSSSLFNVVNSIKIPINHSN
jgi:hypothetical protein